MAAPLYQVDARVWLREESARERRPVRLDTIASATLDAIAGQGFGWLWLRAVWDTGRAAREVASRRAPWLEEHAEALPDVGLQDIDGSPFAVRGYRVRSDLGGDDALEALRDDLARRGLRLLLDVVMSHAALDHPWTREMPELFIGGSEEDLRREPGRWHRTPGGAVIAHPEDSTGAPAPDAAAFNYRHEGLRRAMLQEIERVASVADGVCAVGAALALPGRAEAVWGERSAPRDGSPPAGGSFWLEALPRVRAARPASVFIAEAPGDSRAALEEVGFDSVEDETLLDLLLSGDAGAVRAHLEGVAGRGGAKGLHFLESHGRRRAAGVFPPFLQPAASVVAFLSAPRALLHHGQLEGRRVRHHVHLTRRADEAPDRDLDAFHQRLVEVLARSEVERGPWRMLPVREAWEGNGTAAQIIAGLHRGAGGEATLSAVNFGPGRAQGYVDLSSLETRGRRLIFQDLFSVERHEREGDDIAQRGLYVDLPAWDYNIFEVVMTPPSAS
ncbi:MAG TPA: alpha-amylase [Planctomycetota bacterium]|nr:alpha-amylase [Planctomycetota bacterium]